MDELILKVLAGTATELEVHQVERWRRADEGNEAVFLQHRRVWGAVAFLPGVDGGEPPSLEALVAAAEARRRRSGVRVRLGRAVRSPWWGWGMAAAAVAALVLGVPWRDAPTPEAGLTPVASSTGAENVVTLDLSDGSVLRLAPGSAVDFPAAEGSREVSLRGRAFFAVAGEARPFVVRTAGGDVTVRGTRFEVDASGPDLRVVVVEGTVHVDGPRGSAVVEAGQVAHVPAGAPPQVVTVADVWALLDWQGGLLVYQATPLTQVAGEVARHFGVTVTVAPELEERRITAWFEDETVDEVTAAVCVVVGARCAVGEGTVTMDAPGTGRR